MAKPRHGIVTYQQEQYIYCWFICEYNFCLGTPRPVQEVGVVKSHLGSSLWIPPAEAEYCAVYMEAERWTF